MLAVMRTPGPLATPPSNDRLVLERGRDAMSIDSRMKSVQMNQAALDRTPNEELAHALGCQLLSLSAALIEAGRDDEAGDALSEADGLFTDLQKHYVEKIAPHVQGGVFRARYEVLRAACKYNMAVMHFESNENDLGQMFLQFATDSIQNVSADDRASGLSMYESLVAPLNSLRHLVGL